VNRTGREGVVKRMVLGFATAVPFLMMAGAASGADFSVPRFTGSALFSYWTGAYLGINGGWGWTTTSGLAAKGVLGGGQIGYNYQMGSFVLGVEGDGAFANISQNAVGAAFGTPVSATFKDDALASLRGRFGIAVNNILFYGTAGGGWGQSEISATTLAGANISGKTWQSGWTAGAGIEYAFVPSWSIKLEYLHYGLGSATVAGALNSGNLEIETVKVGVNYLFH
jgi:outer membrane immunogenic protein